MEKAYLVQARIHLHFLYPNLTQPPLDHFLRFALVPLLYCPGREVPFSVLPCSQINVSQIKAHLHNRTPLRRKGQSLEHVLHGCPVKGKQGSLQTALRWTFHLWTKNAVHSQLNVHRICMSPPKEEAHTKHLHVFLAEFHNEELTVC